MGEKSIAPVIVVEKLEIEPGFFKALIMSYALGVALFVAVLIVNYLILQSLT